MTISRWVAALVAMMVLSDGANGHAGVSVMIFLPGVSHPWAATKGNPYAVWAAHSDASVPRTLTFNRSGGVIDSAPLRPQALYASDRDLTDGSRIWLPKGGLLVKMSGGGGNWYCTWRFDDQASATQAQMENDDLSKWGYNLCLQADAKGELGNPRIMIADFKGLMAITDPESGMGRYRNGVGSTNPIRIEPVDSALLPARARIQIHVAWKSAHGGAVCIRPGISNMRSRETLNGSDQCFSGVGDVIRLSGASYTLKALDDQRSFEISIDSPIDTQTISPRTVG